MLLGLRFLERLEHPQRLHTFATKHHQANILPFSLGAIFTNLMNSQKVFIDLYYLVFSFYFNSITNDQVHECVETLKNAFHLITNQPCKLNSEFLTSRPRLIWRRTLLSINAWSFSALTTAISRAGSIIWNKNKYTVAIPKLHFVIWRTTTHSVWAKARFSHDTLRGGTSRNCDDLLERTAALA